MKLLNHSIKARALWLLASFFAVLIAAPLPGLHAQTSREESQSKTTWIQQDGQQKRLLEIRGKAEFTDDYTDIKDVTEGGWVIVEERTDRQWFRYEVRRDPAGQITRAFYANGSARPLDDSAKSWLSKFVLEAVRLKGLFLKAVETIKSDYERGRVLSALLKNKQIG